MLRKKKTMFEKLLYLPLDMEPPPLDCLDKLNDVDFLDIIRDDFRNCWHVPLMFSSTDLNAKKEDIKYLDEPYKWTKFIDKFSTLKEWCEDVLFPFTGKSRIMIITTLPGETNPPHIDCSREKFNTMCRFDKIRLWAEDRGLYHKGDPKTQTLKLMEEAGEICRAVLKKDEEQIIDGIGDCVVVLTNLAHLAGTSIEECIDTAYNEIKDRTGKMSNGTFKKD